MDDVLDVASEVVLPALRAVFRPGEVTEFQLRVSDDDDGTVLLSVSVRDERFDYPVIQGGVGGMSSAEWSENLRSLLVDFVAESRFGWGENREARSD